MPSRYSPPCRAESGAPAGTDPHSPVLLKAVNTCRAVMVLSSLGSVPDSSLSFTSRLVSAVSRPSSVGTYPVIALCSRYLPCANSRAVLSWSEPGQRRGTGLSSVALGPPPLGTCCVDTHVTVLPVFGSVS